MHPRAESVHTTQNTMLWEIHCNEAWEDKKHCNGINDLQTFHPVNPVVRFAHASIQNECAAQTYCMLLTTESGVYWTRRRHTTQHAFFRWGQFHLDGTMNIKIWASGMQKIYTCSLRKSVMQQNYTGRPCQAISKFDYFILTELWALSCTRACYIRVSCQNLLPLVCQ
jgi:hypothetical protein